MFDYAALQGTAADLIAQFGRPCSVRTVSDAVYLPETGEVSATESVSDGLCVFGGLSKQAREAFGGVQAGDMTVTASASCALQAGSVLSCGGELWRMVEVRPIAPAGVVVAYSALARRCDGA